MCNPTNLLDDVSSEDSDDNGSNERTTDDDDVWHEPHVDDELEDEMIMDGVQIEESNEGVNFDIDVDQLQLAEVDTGDVDAHPIQLCNFKIVADNIDKNIRPSYQRIDRQTVSLHYVHALAVCDRIDFSSLSDVVSDHVFIDPSSLLPSTTDLNAVKEEFQILISRYVHTEELSYTCWYVHTLLTGFWYSILRVFLPRKRKSLGISPVSTQKRWQQNLMWLVS